MAETKKGDLAELKKLTIEAKDLSEPANVFFDMTEQPGFTKKQRAIPKTERHQILELVLMATSNAISNITKDVHIEDKFFFEEAEQNFLHGTCLLQNNPAHLGIFYFSDIQVGLVIYVDKQFKTELFRFSLAEQKPTEQIH